MRFSKLTFYSVVIVYTAHLCSNIRSQMKLCFQFKQNLVTMTLKFDLRTEIYIYLQQDVTAFVNAESALKP